MRKLLLVLALTLPLLAAEPDRVVLDSKVLGEQRLMVVHLPASYGAGSQRYPVVYVTDAGSRAGHTADTARALAEVGRMPEVIVVGVVNTDRTRDLTPTRAGELGTSGGAARFISFFETELIPEIEKRYRTAPYRVFAGHSFGGMFALEMLFSKPRLFNAWVAVSPTVWWDGKYPLRRAQHFVETTPELPATLILAVGKETPDMNSTFDELKALLKKRSPKNFTVHSYYFEDDDHASVPIPAHYTALRTLFAPWHFSIGQAGDPKKLWPRAVAHAADLTKRYGFTVPVAEAQANAIGYTLLGAKHFDDAIEVFKANATAFPDSPNVYDSLGEAYEKAGNIAKARESYAQAVEKARAAKDARLPLFQQNLDRIARDQTSN